jgi:hypothetical protein
MILVCTSFVVDGLAWYTANIALFNSMLIVGATLLGLRGVMAVFGKNRATTDAESK